MISVVIPLFNKGNSIEKTISTVISQSYKDFEIVVVNDGSTDNSLEVVRGINDERIRIVDKSNGGVSSARNRGIMEAKYNWIAFLDADDLWEKDHLDTLHFLITKYPLDNVFCTSFTRSNQNQNLKEDNTTIVIEDYFSEAIKYHFFWTSVVLINSSVFKKVGVFNEALSRGEDLDLWARIGCEYRFIKSNKVTAIYVQDSENKLSFMKTSLNKSILNNISFIGLKGTQRRYFKTLILNKVKSAILKHQFSIAFKLLLKYNINLL